MLVASPSIGGDAAEIVGLPALPRKKRNDEIKRPGVRERVPTSECPNLRDSGETLDHDAPRILQNLQRGDGYAFLTEAGYRVMHRADTGLCPGVGTFPAWLDRAAERGELHQMWLTRGGLMPDGSPCKVGVRLVRWAMNRDERNQNRARYARNVSLHGGRYRRERTDGGRRRELFAAMVQARRALPPPPPAATPPRKRWTVAELEAAVAAIPRAAGPPE